MGYPSLGKYQEPLDRLDRRRLVEDGVPSSVWVDAQRNVEHWIGDVVLDVGVGVCSSVVVDARILVRSVVDVVGVVCHVDRHVDCDVVAVARYVDRHGRHVCRRIDRCVVRRVVRGTRSTP